MTTMTRKIEDIYILAPCATGCSSYRQFLRQASTVQNANINGHFNIRHALRKAKNLSRCSEKGRRMLLELCPRLEIEGSTTSKELSTYIDSILHQCGVDETSNFLLFHLVPSYVYIYCLSLPTDQGIFKDVFGYAFPHLPYSSVICIHRGPVYTQFSPICNFSKT
jgi:hypothetical protein